MVLYVESLRVDVANFIQVATTLKGVLEVLGLEGGGYDDSMATSQVNLAVLDRMLAEGITELVVPQKP